jgi:hypothetical protein
VTLAWYAAFGSNLLRARFATYLSGGPVPYRPDRGHQEGARDPAPPLADRPFTLAHRLSFAGSSRSWGGGGVAFIDPEPDPDALCLGRLWLITVDQLADVARQENGLAAAPVIDLDEVEAAGHVDLERGWYRRLLHLGPGPEGHPVLTVTTDRADRHQPRPAHHSYLRVVGLGLMETWDLDPRAAAAYLASSTGNAASVEPAALAADLARRDNQQTS